MCATFLIASPAYLRTNGLRVKAFLEDLCYHEKSVIMNLRYQPTGILMSLPQTGSPELFECTVVLQPPGWEESSIVVSIYKYDVNAEDLLTIEDSDRFKIRLTGYGNFKDEKKALISDGKMVITYRRNATETSNLRQGFQLTYTLAPRRNRCYENEFRCDNNLCILRDYVCDGHNHCGDGSDQKKCVPWHETTTAPKSSYNPYEGNKNSKVIWISIIGAAGIVVFVIVVVFVVVVVRRSKAQKAMPAPDGNNQNSGGNIPLQSVSSTVPQQQQPAHAMPSAPPAPDHEGFSFYNRVRRSLRGLKSPKAQDTPKETVPSEVYQVPSMYPNLDQHGPESTEAGIENPDFKIEE